MTSHTQPNDWEKRLVDLGTTLLAMISLISWSGIKHLSQSPIRYFTFTISVIPIVVGMFSISADSVAYLERELPEVLETIGPMFKLFGAFISDQTGRLLLIYFGMVSFSIATLLYQALAPEWIRNFKDRDEAVVHYLDIAQRADTAGAPRIRDEYVLRAHDVHERYSTINKMNLAQRALCSTLFLVSFFCLLIGTALNFYKMVSVGVPGV